ncbi:unnamed protein product [Amoebophrya sp. A25]|nr:unnamed protein product [Amoebophrya sp. A25]|eukprot:GSA25T00000158001.1
MATGPAGPLCTGLSSIKRAPKWTLGSREEDKATLKRQQFGPGPAAYFTKDISVDARHVRPTSAVFPHSKRDEMGATSGGKRPGVGTYNPNFMSSSTMSLPGRPVFSKGSRDDAGSMTAVATRAKTPGPGTYGFKASLSDISSSIYGRAKDFSRPVTPGPGAYSISRELSGAGWKMGTGQRSGIRSRSESPGPGQYSLTSAISTNHPSILRMPQYTMVPRRAILTGRNQSPGPGAHGGSFTTFGY